ncbi:MAG: hypothetical protein Ta2F_04120 [Termitinemataceae bacterium]|nr:MAG: hypothetical protein Ta2F_04120 [Termitinemataceae bacterium]
MIKSILQSFIVAAVVTLFLVMPVIQGEAAGSKDGSEVLVQRVDNNSLIRLRVYIDARAAGSLRVGETVTYKIRNGPHTIRVAFEDFQARSTEVTQFNSFNSRHFFTVTDESIVSVGQEQLKDENSGAPSVPIVESAPPPQQIVQQPVSSSQNMRNGEMVMEDPIYTMDTSVRNAFEKATKNLKKKTLIAVINVDADNPQEGVYILEEITYLSVQSPKAYQVMDRRKIDAFRTKNAIDLPSYDNDFQLLSFGNLMGVDVVISARIDGPGDLRRLRVKALDVKTGLLVGDSSERI